ncbi:hypothetical protein FACS1894145_4450 [Bacteroidia bacterium]|nr:hypothetical protein FACS1894145_4450 [Bacteroidia bacterium]
MSATEDWKYLVLSRFAAEYPPYAGAGQKIQKNSEDIAFDLSGMGEISPTEVSVFLAVSSYEVGFDEDKPVWLLTKKSEPEKSITE